MPVVAKRVGTDEGVEPVVFGACHAVPVSEPVEPIGIDGEDIEFTLEQSFHDRSMGKLESNSTSTGIDQTGLVELTGVIDPGEHNITSGHGNFTSVNSSPRLGSAPPLYWRSWRNSPQDAYLGFTRREASSSLAH